MLRVLDAAAIRRWADVAVDRLEARRDELDRTNVFPVADGDTGTNLALTLRAGAEALGREPGAATAAEVAAALARGALRGARGNSGVIVSQLPRGLAEALGDGGEHVDGTVLSSALGRAEALARAAVSNPVEGTVLTVLRAAAQSAAEAATRTTDDAEAAGDLAGVAAAAASGAAAALAETPRQLPVLARAGVVDAGGQGLVLVLEALVEVVTGRPPAVPPPGRYRAPNRGSLTGVRESGSAEFDYEVMYLLEETTQQRVAALRARLEELGDSVALVGDGTANGAGVWNVHVHCGDVGAAIEAGVEAGRPRRITVVRFADQRSERERRDRYARERAVVTVVNSEAVAGLVRGDGVTALVAGSGGPPGAGEIAAAVVGTQARHVVVLPNDLELNPVAEEAADLVRTSGGEIVVVPTSSVLQGLAALAVHDPQRRAGDDVVAMAEAAAATRTGVVRLATEDALTWVGRCYAGDVLGLVDGEVVLIEHDLGAGVCQLADRMLTTGGELVTVLLGTEARCGTGARSGTEEDGGAPDDVVALGELLVVHLRHSHPEVEVVVYRGGPADRPLQLGVE